jgi:3-oxoacyl-[acyl-carrier protein] reductase
MQRVDRTAACEWEPNLIGVNNILPVADTWGVAEKEAPPATNALGR